MFTITRVHARGNRPCCFHHRQVNGRPTEVLVLLCCTGTAGTALLYVVKKVPPGHKLQVVIISIAVGFPIDMSTS